jgi:ATP-dependent helicase/nuclease subunit A
MTSMAAQLTEEQEPAAARRSEPLALSAAAGSGKTSVLVERFVRAVIDDDIKPAQILAITFTERAAGELRSRVRARLLELGRREAARDTEAAFVGTFHGFCARLLRAHPLAAELDPAFAILDEGRAGRLREQAFKIATAGFLEDGRSEAVDLLAAYKVDRVAKIILGAHAELRSRGERRPTLPAPAVEPDDLDGIDAAGACVLFDELLGRFADAYEELKQLRGGVDFDDLELAAGQLLEERPLVRRAWSERFQLLMVDEFQDTNPRQLAILRALEHANLFTVGDEFQSIYGFRHADVDLFRARRDELALSGQSLSLTRNFRSRRAVLGVVNEVFSERFADYSPLLAGRTPEAEQEGPEIELLINDRDGWGTLWRQAEARMLAGRIAELVASGGARAGEIVVLLRSTGDLDLFDRALALRGLRTLAAVGAFWGQQQIADLLSYLRALANPLDELALHSALASPLGGCSLDALALLAGAARRRRRGLWETAGLLLAGEDIELAEELGGGDRAALGRFCELLADERARLARRTISELIERALEVTGYREHVLGLDWGERRIANVHKLLRLARRYEAAEGRDLRGFLEQVAYLKRAAAIEPNAPVEGVEPDAIRLMTIHAAKGLEFPVVCVADMGRRPNYQSPDLLVDGDRLGIRLVRLDGGESTHALEFDPLLEERRVREAEEEDRILYVAMTRARDRLLLCGTVTFENWPKPTSSPLAWVAPALDPDLPELLGAGAEPGVLRVGPAGIEVRLHVSRAGAEQDAPAAPVAAPGTIPPPQPPGESAPVPAPAAASRSAADQGPPAMSGSLSYSSLSELERCGYRFYLERVLRLGEDRAPARGAEKQAGLEPRARGTLVHLLMERLDFAAGTGPTAEHLMAAAGELRLAPSAEEALELAALIATAAGGSMAARIAAAKLLGREYPFALSLGPGEPLLTGFIDLLAEEPGGGGLLIDYKSDRVGPESDLEEIVEREYGVQRLLYALATLRSGAPRVEIVHWFLERPGEPAAAIYEASMLAELEARLTVLVGRARAGVYEVSPRPHRALCETCPGRRALCSWGEQETLREGPQSEPEAPPEDPGGSLRLF